MPFARTASPASAEAGVCRPFHVRELTPSSDGGAVRPDMRWTCKVGRQRQQNRQQPWPVSRIGPPGPCVLLQRAQLPYVLRDNAAVAAYADGGLQRHHGAL